MPFFQLFGTAQRFRLYQTEGIGEDNKMIEWCFKPLLTVFQSYHGDSSHYSCLSWVSPVLGQQNECGRNNEIGLQKLLKTFSETKEVLVINIVTSSHNVFRSFVRGSY